MPRIFFIAFLLLAGFSMGEPARADTAALPPVRLLPAASPGLERPVWPSHSHSLSPYSRFVAGEGELQGVGQLPCGRKGLGRPAGYRVCEQALSLCMCGVSLLARTSAPSLSGISPNKINAGGPNDLILTAKGSNFAATSLVSWTMGSTTTALTTSYVSPYELQADVPAALLATPGIAYVTVTTPGAGTSKAKSFTLLVTTLKVIGAHLSRDSGTGEITAIISLQNEGYLTAPNVAIMASTLGLAATDTFLPISPGNIPAGATATTLLTYPGFAGGTGTKTKLSLYGTFTGGNFTGSLTMKLP